MGGNLMLIHGGGPTAVLNASLYGAITEAKRHGDIGRILAAKGGTGGLLRDEVLDLTDLPADKLSLLLTTPGSAIGTSRDALDAADYARMRDMLAARGVFYTLMGGGNGTMDACGKLCARCQGTHIRVIGIPTGRTNCMT